MINLRWKIARWLLNDPEVMGRMADRVAAAIAKECEAIGVKAEQKAKAALPLHSICDACGRYKPCVTREVTEYVGTMFSTAGNREMSATRLLRLCERCAQTNDEIEQEGAA